MKFRPLALALSAVLLVLGLAAPMPAQAAAASRYIVTVQGDGPVADLVSSLLTTAGGGRVLQTYDHALRGATIEATPAVASALAALPLVATIELDGVVSLDSTEANPPSYGIDRIDQRSLPLSRSYSYTTTGAGVRAYIIDTGIRGTHVDFGGRAVPGTNTVDATSPFNDCVGHGTHVAGTVGGTSYGVAKGVTLVAVKVFGCSSSTSTSAIIAGIDWAAADHQAGQPAVANMSLGGGGSAALDTAVRGLIADGVSVSVAAGNDNANPCSSDSPARVGEAIVVGATDSTDTRASFSDYGACVDYHAPGVNIVSAWYTSDTATNTISGTSMATPHSTGAAARYLQAHPSATPADVQSALVAAATPGAVKGIATSCSLFQNLLGTCTAGTPNRLLYVDAAG